MGHRHHTRGDEGGGRHDGDPGTYASHAMSPMQIFQTMN
jgi:hypothetical protein